jgi:hypothetical protein
MAALAKQNNDEAGSCTPNACTTRSSGLELMAASVAATIPPNTPHSTIALVDMAVMYTSTSAMTTRCDRVWASEGVSECEVKKKHNIEAEVRSSLVVGFPWHFVVISQEQVVDVGLGCSSNSFLSSPFCL